MPGITRLWIPGMYLTPVHEATGVLDYIASDVFNSKEVT